MLSPKDFVAAWGKKVPLVRFRKKALESLTIADEDKRFLAEAGLPESAAPFLSFAAPKSGELPTLADQWKQSAKFRRYRVIGADGSGSPIAIDEERKGEVVCLDHDDKFAGTFMNSSVRQMAESLLAYRDLIAAEGKSALKDGALPAKARNQLHQQIQKIDADALKPGCFWSDEAEAPESSASPGSVPKVVQDLSSTDGKVRLKASKQLESELRKGVNKQRQDQFGNKETTSALIGLLDDLDPNIAHNAVVALTQVSRSYFKDDRAYAKLLGLVHSKHPLTTRWVIDALIQLRGEASLNDVLPLCADPSQETRAMALTHLYSWLARSGSVKPEIQKRLREAATRALSDHDRTVRGNAATLLGAVGDATALPTLRQALKKESYWLTEQTITNAIKAIEDRTK